MPMGIVVYSRETTVKTMATTLPGSVFGAMPSHPTIAMVTTMNHRECCSVAATSLDSSKHTTPARNKAMRSKLCSKSLRNNPERARHHCD